MLTCVKFRLPYILDHDKFTSTGKKQAKKEFPNEQALKESAP